MKTLHPGPDTSRRLAAYHEAGHAVASFFRPLAGPTTWVTIRGSELDEGDAGAHYSRSRPPAAGELTSESEQQVARALAVVALAGCEVDRRLTGNALTSGSEDYEAVRDLLFRVFFDREIEALVNSVEAEEAKTRGLDEIAAQAADAVEDHLKHLVDDLRMEAHELIGSKWGQVEAVAEALLEHEALAGDRVRQIIEAVDLAPPHSNRDRS